MITFNACVLGQGEIYVLCRKTKVCCSKLSTGTKSTLGLWGNADIVCWTKEQENVLFFCEAEVLYAVQFNFKKSHNVHFSIYFSSLYLIHPSASSSVAMSDPSRQLFMLRSPLWEIPVHLTFWAHFTAQLRRDVVVSVRNLEAKVTPCISSSNACCKNCPGKKDKKWFFCVSWKKNPLWSLTVSIWFFCTVPHQNEEASSVRTWLTF